MFGSNRKDAAFFDAFSQHATETVQAAKTLLVMMRLLESKNVGGAFDYGSDAATPVDDEAKALSAKIKEAERAGDKITHQTVTRLRENWITPLDRGDIHALISRMDDVLDFIEEAAERVVLFEVRVAPPEARELAEILVESCEALAKAIGLLRSMKKAPEILELCVEINRLENKADAVHRKALAGLFRPGHDPLVVMKWRDLFDSLESAADATEDVANIVEGVVLEYG